MRILTMVLCVLGGQVEADLNAAGHLAKTFYATFAESAQTLDVAAQQNCSAAALKPYYHASFDAWVAASVIQFGPIMEIGGPLNFAFWPDKKDFTTKSLGKLISNKDGAVAHQATFEEVSVAARGFMALERLMYDEAFSDYKQGSYICELVRAITADMRTKAISIGASWHGSFDDEVNMAMRSIGTQFKNKNEVAAAYLTSVTTGLEYIETTQLARPIGSVERARPRRAEAWRSGRSLRNIQIRLRSLNDLATVLADGNAPTTKQRFENLIAFSKTVSSADFQDAHEIAVRFELQSLSSLVNLAREAATAELSAHLGVASGFNALDGD